MPGFFIIDSDSLKDKVAAEFEDTIESSIFTNNDHNDRAGYGFLVIG